MRRTQNTEKVREDFDRIADLSEEDGWNHNAHYHAFLLGQLPGRLGDVLEVGCGTGAFARSLAERCERANAIDLSPRMVEVARSRSGEHPNIEYLPADANSWAFPERRFDCVASITTLHHLPLAPTLRKMGGALRPGGTLLVLDLYRARSAADYLVGAAGFPASKALRLADGRPVPSSVARAEAGLEGTRRDGRLPGPRRGTRRLRRGATGREGEEAPALALLRDLAQAGPVGEGPGPPGAHQSF